jgi:hypothetical protein
MLHSCRSVKTIFLCLVVGCATVPPPPVTTLAGIRMKEDLTYIASRQLAGRLAGTPGNDSAAAFIARRYAHLGLQPAFNTPCDDGKACGKSFLQLFGLSPTAMGEASVPIRGRTQNVGAVVEGTDSLLRHAYIVVGGHYDHLGSLTSRSRDGLGFGVIHPGADDNGSGTVAVLELARRFASHPARRSVLFANFSAEELGLIGSYVFVQNSPVPAADILAMVNLDMVGRMRDNHLILFAGGSLDRFRLIVDSLEKASPDTLHLSWKPARAENSDLLAFDDEHIPVLAPFTDFHPDYHRAGDVVERINFVGLEKVVDLTERVIRALADGEGSK